MQTIWMKKWEELSPFKQARIKLTGYYMLIFTLILVGFTLLTFQAKQSAFVRVYTVVDQYDKGGQKTVDLQDKLDDYTRRFKDRVILFDLGLWALALWLAWGLSGKTLKPIQDTVEEQANFTADVSHGLRTPLATMSLEIEAFNRTHKLTRQTKDLFSSLQEEIGYLTRITEGVLSLTRTKKTNIKQEMVWVDLTELVSKTAAAFIPLASQKKQTIKTAKLDKVKIMANNDQIKQVLTILVDNAIKYGDKGITITIAITKETGLVRLQVSDTGPGINPEEKKRIFKRFYRSSNTKNLSRGAGLGLAIAQKIIEAHDGHIRVKSVLGQGSTFTVTLPINS